MYEDKYEFGKPSSNTVNLFHYPKPLISAAFNMTYEHDGSNSVTETYITAYGKEEFGSNHDGKSYFHAFIIFIGLPSRTGDNGFTPLQLIRDLFGGWNSLRNNEGEEDISEKGWWNIVASFLLIKSLIIPVFKLVTWPLKLTLNIIKLGTEFLPYLLSNLLKDLFDYTDESIRSDRQGFTYVLLIVPFIISGILTLTFYIIHKFGMMLTSPEKSFRYWILQGETLTKHTFLKNIPVLNYLLPVLFGLISIAISAFFWAITLPLAISTLTAAFPAILPAVTWLANLPFIASTFSMINGTVITISTTLAGIFTPVIAAMEALAFAVGIPVTATTFAVGFTLGAIAAPIAIVLTNLADKASNLWAKFKDDGPFVWIKMGLSPKKFIDRSVETIFTKNNINAATNKLLHILNRQTRSNREALAAYTEEKIYSHRNDTGYNEKLTAFKKALTTPSPKQSDSLLYTPNWKDIIYGANYSKLLSARSTELEVDFNSNQPIGAKNRNKDAEKEENSRLLHPPAPDAAVTMGTTFFTNSQQILTRSGKPDSNLKITHHVMDSCLCAYHHENGKLKRIYMAMADGLGGHLGDKEEDRRISKASYFGCKHAIRLCSMHDDPDTLKKELPGIIEKVGNEVFCKNNNSHESTTLTCATVFKQGNQSRVIGVNIGDSMLAAWNPKTQELITLLPARHSVTQIGEGPAPLPASYNINTDIDLVDYTLSSDCVLIPFTDGMTGPFNTIIKEEIRDNKKYKVFNLDPEWVKALLGQLGSNPSAQAIVQTLMTAVMQQAEQDRTNLNNNHDTALTDVQRVKDEQEDSRKRIDEAKKDLNGLFESLYAQQERKDITADDYNLKRAPLNERRKTLDKETAELNEKLASHEQHLQITYGDDIGVMAVRLNP